MEPIEPLIENQDDELDKILFLESEIQDVAIEQGIVIGKQRAFEQGFSIGKTKGFEVGIEIGYFQAYCTHYIKNQTRALLQLKELLQLTNEFKFENDANFDVEQYLKLCRIKFKVINSIIGQSTTRKVDDLSF